METPAAFPRLCTHVVLLVLHGSWMALDLKFLEALRCDGRQIGASADEGCRIALHRLSAARSCFCYAKNRTTSWLFFCRHLTGFCRFGAQKKRRKLASGEARGGPLRAQKPLPQPLPSLPPFKSPREPVLYAPNEAAKYTHGICYLLHMHIYIYICVCVCVCGGTRRLYTGATPSETLLRHELTAPF